MLILIAPIRAETSLAEFIEASRKLEERAVSGCALVRRMCSEFQVHASLPMEHSEAIEGYSNPNASRVVLAPRRSRAEKLAEIVSRDAMVGVVLPEA